MTTIHSFRNRLKKIGIEITMIGNFPWVYMHTVNGVRVEGTYMADHGFTIFMMAIRKDERGPYIIQDIPTIFKKIRETLGRTKSIN